MVYFCIQIKEPIFIVSFFMLFVVLKPEVNSPAFFKEITESPAITKNTNTNDLSYIKLRQISGIRKIKIY